MKDVDEHNLIIDNFLFILTFFLPPIVREFLTGFRKRKQERRKKAKDELEQQVKEERKRIKQEVSQFTQISLNLALFVLM